MKSQSSCRNNSRKKDLIHQKREYITNLEYLKLRDLDIGQLSSMKYLRFRLLKLSRNNYLKLKKNYENIRLLY